MSKQMIFLCVCSLSACIFAQSANPPALVPTHILYRHFLAYQSHLDRAAAAAAEQGKNASDLRNHFQQRLGFSDSQFAFVRAAAVKMDADLAPIDAKARAIIDAVHKQHPGPLKSRADLPPVPPELEQLQQQRDQLIKNEVTALKTALGPKDAAKLDALLQNDFAPNVTVQTIPVSPRDPGRSKAPSFAQQGVQ